MIGEMNYALVNYYWGACKPTNSLKYGDVRWAVGYYGTTWGSTAARLNSNVLQTDVYVIFQTEFDSFRSDHPGGVNFAFVDGSVHYLSDDIDQTVLKALSTRDGKETVDVSAF